jgi:hypothetical protein
METKKDDCCYRTQHNQPACQSHNPSNKIEGSAQITVACRILVAMTAQAITFDEDFINFALGMQFITDMSSTAFTFVLVDVMRGTRGRPLIGIDLDITHITHLRLLHFHLLFGTG